MKFSTMTFQHSKTDRSPNKDVSIIAYFPKAMDYHKNKSEE